MENNLCVGFTYMLAERYYSMMDLKKERKKFTSILYKIVDSHESIGIICEK
jgi:hypothetical protein